MPKDPREQFSDLRFPGAGLDLSEGYAAQRRGTTRQGANVRTAEPLTQRLRGGSRPGLTKYIASPQLGQIQNLAVLVDPQGTALLANFLFSPPDISDPSTPGLSTDWPPGQSSRIPPGQIIPQGGTLVQPNKKVPMQGTVVPQTIKLVQSLLTTSGSNATFTSNVTSGNLLLVGMRQRTNGGALDGTISDSQGNSWTNAGYSACPGDAAAGVGLFWAIANATGANTVTAAGTGVAVIPAVISEWSGVSHTTTFDNAQTGGGDQPGSSGTYTLSTSAVTLSASGELLVGYFSVPDNPAGDGSDFNPAAGFTKLQARVGECFIYQIGPPAGSLAPSTTEFLNSNSRWCAIGASFKPAG